MRVQEREQRQRGLLRVFRAWRAQAHEQLERDLLQAFRDSGQRIPLSLLHLCPSREIEDTLSIPYLEERECRATPEGLFYPEVSWHESKKLRARRERMRAQREQERAHQREQEWMQRQKQLRARREQERTSSPPAGRARNKKKRGRRGKGRQGVVLSAAAAAATAATTAAAAAAAAAASIAPPLLATAGLTVLGWPPCKIEYCNFLIVIPYICFT